MILKTKLEVLKDKTGEEVEVEINLKDSKVALALAACSVKVAKIHLDHTQMMETMFQDTPFPQTEEVAKKL